MESIIFREHRAPQLSMNGSCKPFIEVIDVKTGIKRCKTDAS